MKLDNGLRTSFVGSGSELSASWEAESRGEERIQVCSRSHNLGADGTLSSMEAEASSGEVCTYSNGNLKAGGRVSM